MKQHLNIFIINMDYKIHYAYGGQFPGQIRRVVSINADTEEDALKLFNEQYNSEIIYSIKQVTR